VDPNNTSIEKIKRHIERIWKRKPQLNEEETRRLRRIEAAARKPDPADVLWVASLEERLKS